MSLWTMHESNKKNIIKQLEPIQSSRTEELLSLIQELSSRNQELFLTNQKLSVANSDLTEMIQELRSDEQILKSKVAQQAELIEKLNGSDLELKKAEDLQNRLKEKEKHWQSEVKRSQEEALNAEKRANIAILQANSEKEKAEKKKSEYNSLIASEKKIIDRKAKELNDQFRIKWQWVMLILIVYSGLATLFTGYKSERVHLDCINAFNTVISTLMTIINGIESISVQISNTVGVPEPVVVIFVAVVTFGIIGVIMFFGRKFVVNVYQEYCYDEISLVVVLVSVAILIWFAEFMPLNIVLILILSHIVYIGVRWYIEGYKENH